MAISQIYIILYTTNTHVHIRDRNFLPNQMLRRVKFYFSRRSRSAISYRNGHYMKIPSHVYSMVKHRKNLVAHLEMAKRSFYKFLAIDHKHQTEMKNRGFQY